MPELWTDARFAVRVMGRQKLLTLVAALTLGLGIGMNTAIFSVVSSVLWNSLPYEDPAALVTIWGANAKAGFTRSSIAARDVQDWREARSLENLSVQRTLSVGLSASAEPRSILAVESDARLFPVLREKPVRGRIFEDREERVAVVTHGLWQREFGGDPAALGREIKVDGAAYTVIGILGPEFTFLYSDAEVFIPFRLTAQQLADRGYRGLRCIGRLAPGATLAQAQAEIAAISSRIEQAEPATSRGWSGVVHPLEDDIIDRGARLSINTMFWAVMGVLLIACVNIASLLLARGTLRQRELAIRASLGAGRARIMRLLVTESLALSLLGGVFGALFAYGAIPVLVSLAPPKFPRLELVGMDTKALLYTFALCLVTGLVAGVMPAWMLSKGELARALHQGGRGGTFSRQRVLQGLVAGEVGLAVILLTVTVLLTRSLVGQLAADPGFDKTNLVIAQLSLPPALYATSLKQAEFHRAAVAALKRDPRLAGASVAQTIPLGGSSSWSSISIEGRQGNPDDPAMAGLMNVMPGYLDVMRIPLLSGRDLSEADTADSPRVAVINQTMARQFWPGDRQPLGRRFRFGGPNEAKNPWITVVGISRDVRHNNPALPPRPEMHIPITQASSARMIYVVRAAGDPAQAATALRTAIASVDRNQAIGEILAMDTLISRRAAGPRVTAQILGFLAGLALLLAGLGIYGVLSYLTSQRAREIGIRVAMGAVPANIVNLVMRRGLWLTLAGLGAGLAAAAGITPLVRSLLTGIEPHDPATFSAAALALLVVACLACAAPVWRALRTDPVRVLRED